jgi:hypothetical protein
MTYIPMTKHSMCRYSYKKSVEISKHFKDNRLQQNGVIPIFLWLLFLWSIFLWPNHLCVDIPTKNLLKYRTILMILDFSKTTNHYFNNPMPLCVDISTDQSSYVSIFLQTKVPMCRYYYRPKLLCVDIPTETSRYFNELKLLFCDTSTSFFVL